MDNISILESLKKLLEGRKLSLSETEILKEIHEFLVERKQKEKEELTFPPSREISPFPGIIGNCPKMQEVYKTMREVIASNVSTVLITGETGTGKELVARALHYHGKRREGPFVEVNCAAIPENLLEAELFGYEAGAFTDAKSRKLGLLEVAHGGTLFLDEIGYMPLHLQVKMLKCIEEQKFRRLGGTEDIKVKIWIIAATNRDLLQAIESGTFRKDLYYRLNVITIELPPLRERGDDIILLSEHFLEHFAKKYKKPRKTLSEEAKKLLLKHLWPGNVRELKHTMERAILLSDSPVLYPSDIPIDLRTRVPLDSSKVISQAPFLILPPSGCPLEEILRVSLKQTLELTKGNKSEAARILGISRPRLLRMLRKFGVERGVTKNSKNSQRDKTK